MDIELATQKYTKVTSDLFFMKACKALYKTTWRFLMDKVKLKSLISN